MGFRQRAREGGGEGVVPVCVFSDEVIVLECKGVGRCG